jgi:hypothetical protein
MRLPVEPLALSDYPGSALALGEEQDGAPAEWLRAELQDDGNVRVSLGDLPPGVSHIDMEIEVNGEIVQSFHGIPATAGMPLADFPGTEPVVELATANGNELLASILSQEPDQPAVKQTLRVRHLGRARVHEAVVNVRITGVPEIGIGQPALQATLRESPTRRSKVYFSSNDEGLMEVSGGQCVVSPLRGNTGNEPWTMKGGLHFDPADEFRAVIPPPFGMFDPVPTNAELRVIVRGIIDQDDDGDGVSTLVEGDVDMARFVASAEAPFAFDFTWSSERVHPARRIYWVYGPGGAHRLEFPGNSNVVVNLEELPIMQGKLGGRTPCRRLNWPKLTSLRVAGQTYEATELRVLVETDNYPVRALTGLRLEAEGAESLTVAGLGVGPDEYRLDSPELTPEGVFLRWSGFGGLLEEAPTVLGPWEPTPGQFEQTQGEVLTPVDPAARLKIFRVRGR